MAGSPKSKNIRIRPRIRITVGEDIALGPGKIDLLEAIDRAGSISAAARDLGLSYRRAWNMVDTMNHAFKTPLVEPARGGKRGGGAVLTDMGRRAIRLYRSMESKAMKALDADWQTLRTALKQG